jgi:hypothetical protein
MARNSKNTRTRKAQESSHSQHRRHDDSASEIEDSQVECRGNHRNQHEDENDSLTEIDSENQDEDDRAGPRNSHTLGKRPASVQLSRSRIPVRREVVVVGSTKGYTTTEKRVCVFS